MNLFNVKYLTRDQDLVRKVEKFLSDWSGDGLFIETNTSGSTGAPKTIRLEKEKMRFSARMTGAYFGFGPGQKILLCLSPDSIGGKMLMVRAILHDMELIVADVQRNPLEKIDFEVSFAAMVPYQIQAVIAESPGKLDLVKNLLIGGAAVSPKLENALRPFKTKAYESFGMTETMSHVAVRKLNQPGKAPFEGLQGIRFSLKDEKLVIHAPELGLPELETNDVVELAGDRAFFWKGRADFAVNSGGVKLHPELIEKKLAPFMEQRFFLAGMEDVTLGEKLILIIEGNGADLPGNEIRELLKSRLSGYEIPKEVHFTPAFAETVSGKVNRRETLKMAGL